MAIKIPDFHEYEKVLRDFKHDLDVRLSITSPENYHLTLHFFGEITQEEVRSIDQAMDTIEFTTFRIDLKDQGTIPKHKPKKTRVLYVNVDHNAIFVQSIVKTIRKELKKEGFQIPKRKFLPHMTVARVKGGRDVKKLYSRWLDYNFPTKVVDVDNIKLIKSELLPSGAKYTEIRNY